MNTQEITLCGKPVTLGYCYATEIAYKNLAGQDINDFMTEVREAITANLMPDIEKTIFLLLASMLSYYESRKEEIPVKSEDLMNDCTPPELGTALGTILAIRSKFYNIPTGEPEDKPEKGTRRRKNA